MPKTTGNDAIDEIAKEPNLDWFFDANPKTFTDDDYRRYIQQEREKRAMFIDKKGK